MTQIDQDLPCVQVCMRVCVRMCMCESARVRACARVRVREHASGLAGRKVCEWACGQKDLEFVKTCMHRISRESMCDDMSSLLCVMRLLKMRKASQLRSSC